MSTSTYVCALQLKKLYKCSGKKVKSDSCSPHEKQIQNFHVILKFIYSVSVRGPENFAKSPPYFWLVLHTDKSKVEISQNFMAFSEFLTKYNQKTSFVKTIWFVKRFIKAQKSFFIKNAVNSSIDFNLIIAPYARLCLSNLGGDISTWWE